MYLNRLKNLVNVDQVVERAERVEERVNVDQVEKAVNHVENPAKDHEKVVNIANDQRNHVVHIKEENHILVADKRL